MVASDLISLGNTYSQGMKALVNRFNGVCNNKTGKKLFLRVIANELKTHSYLERSLSEGAVIFAYNKKNPSHSFELSFKNEKIYWKESSFPQKMLLKYLKDINYDFYIISCL